MSNPLADAPAPGTIQIRLSRVAFTGRFASMTRAQGWETVKSVGGTPVAGVNRRTTMLVIGMYGWPLLPTATQPRSAAADELRVGGHTIRIVSEEAFLELAGLRQCRADLRKSFDAEQVGALTGADAGALRLWDRLGLVRADRGKYDFQDIVSLQTITRLLAEGVDAAAIARTIRSLAAVLPGTDRPLAQLKLVAAGRGIAAEIGEALIGADGQLRLRFDAPRQGEHASHARGSGTSAEDAPQPLALSLPGEPATFEEWLELGLDAEDDGRLNDAERAYRRAASLAPQDAFCQFNLGNVLLTAGRRAAAEERFRQAIALDPTFGEARYNLAIALDDAGRPHEAAAELESLLGLDRFYADAYFNLADLYQRLGRRADAAPLWRAFLKLEPQGEWAEKARARL